MSALFRESLELPEIDRGLEIKKSYFLITQQVADGFSNRLYTTISADVNFSTCLTRLIFAFCELLAHSATGISFFILFFYFLRSSDKLLT